MNSIVGGTLLIAIALTCASAHETVITDNAPAAVGPYSQGVLAGDTLYLAGQIAIEPVTGEFAPGTIEEETALALRNIKAVVEASGMTMDSVVSIIVYMPDLDEFSLMNEIYGSFFPENPPARTTVEVRRLPYDAKVKISAVAVRQ